MRRWLIVCLLAACERAGDAQNPLGSTESSATPTGPRAIVDASVATLPNDAVEIAADAAPRARDAAVARPDARPRDTVAISQDDMKHFADLLTGLPSNGKDLGDMSKRRPGVDLGGDIANINGGRQVTIGGGGTGRGTRGGGDVRVGGPVVTGVGPKDSTEPRGRISIASKRAVDTTSLTADLAVAKVQSVYMAGIKRCYKTHLDKDPAARGRVTLAFTVLEIGSTANARASGFVAEIDSCLASQMSNWRFPIPKDNDGEKTTAGFEIVLQLVPD